MRRSHFSIVAGALLIGVAGHANAQNAEGPAKAGEPGFATVIGISRGDMLNIRAAASATGMTIARVPNGTLLKVAGCDVVGANLWCRVEDAGDATATGWTPARYLSGYDEQATDTASADSQPSDADSIMSSDATFGGEPAKPKRDARQRDVVASFYIEPLPKAEPGAEVDGREGAGSKAVATIASPTSLTDLGAPDTAVAPFIALPVEPGEGTDIVLAPAPGKPATDVPGEADQAPAVANPAAAAEPESAPPADPESAGKPGSDQKAEAAAAPTDVAPSTGVIPGANQESAAQQDILAKANVPEPTAEPVAVSPAPVAAPAMPDAAQEPDASAGVSPLRRIAKNLQGLLGLDKIEAGPDIIAALVAGDTGAVASNRVLGDVPCARYLGQAMTVCRASVVRESAQDAVVTVTWPDGGQRVIRFRGGQMEGSDSPQPFNAVREADLNMIRIGRTERFEITDALAFGS